MHARPQVKTYLLATKLRRRAPLGPTPARIPTTRRPLPAATTLSYMLDTNRCARRYRSYPTFGIPTPLIPRIPTRWHIHTSTKWSG